MHNELISSLRTTFGRLTLGDQHDATMIDVRYLGAWEVPAGEEDDGDYDWKVPTAETHKALDAICSRLGYTYSVEEKEWITFVKKRTTPKATSTKYDYPAGMTAEQKRKFRAQARRAAKGN